VINDQALLSHIREKRKGEGNRRECAECFCTGYINVNVLFTCRIGTFFSPVMPAMGIVKLFIIFYVELVCASF